MITTIGVAVLLLTTVTLLNLALTLAVIRRLRALQMWETTSSAPTPGTVVNAFNAATIDGRELNERSVAEGSHLVLFLSASCQPCQDLADAIERGAHSLPEGSIAFISADTDEPEVSDLAVRLRRVVSVAVDSSGSTARAFQVESFPTVLMVTDGVITTVGHQPDDVLAAANRRA